ncbi:Ig-like domain-containing protein [Methanobrevibacter sp. UBA188]|uniref:Ig-like domain-containing protein n=2 Tax=Methanobrevibacter TaxID=2172 RepID=UPI0025CBC716|nr:Ig-like domain-containing protein [Methanobrevibacter sp. UBA188]
MDVEVETNVNRVTLTVKVDENATGFVEVKSGDSVSNIALENGEATLTITLPYGSYTLDVTYLGDDNYNKNSTKAEFTLVEPAKANTPISLDVVTEENNVVMTVNVDEAATGLVKFQVTGEEEYTLYADVVNGKAVLEDILETGDYRVIATYMGDIRFNTNITSEDFTIAGHIKKDIPISASADVTGNRVKLTVKVDEDATGFVKLSVGGTVANIEVDNGIATLTTTLVPGSYYVDVTYLGDDDYNMNKTSVTFTIVEASKKNTPINLDIDVYEDAALVMVDVDKSATGLVKFYMVGKESGEEYTMYMDVINGHVETFTNSIEPGNYTVVATYMGDSVFNTNTTSKDVEILGHLMKDTPIDVEVETNVNRVILTVKVDENATGFVEVKSGDSVSNIALENGEATLTITLPYGSYTLDVTYLGDDNYNKNSTKAEFTLVEPSKENTTISLDVVTEENSAVMTVNVDEAATGLVKFQVTGEKEYTLYVDVINGQAVLEDILDTGDYTVVATYMGDSRFNTNITSKDFTIVGHIKKDTPITASAVVNGNRVTLTVNVDENATGFVKVTVGSTVTNIEVVDGTATLTTVLVPNSYFVDVTYIGDDNFNMNKTSVTFTITDIAKKNTNIDLNIDVYEDAALVKVDINESATGLVKFYMVGKESGEEYTMYMDVIDGHVETFTNSIEPGNYTVVATYMGDSVFNTNTTSKDVEILGHLMKDTPIDVEVETNANRVTLTVKVDENATGFVEVKSGVSVSNIALENGEATLTITLPYGSYALDVTYLGDYNYNKNSTKAEFTLVEPAKENTPISLDVDTVENNVTMTVTVDDTATGLIKFQITGPEEYTLYADVINGKAVLEYVLLTGDYTVVATYMGDDWYNTNITSEDFTIVGHIKKDTPISARADVSGNRVTLTVNVDENATGFVRLAVGGTVANIEVVDGVAKLTTNLLPNSYFVEVTYLGDDNFNMNSTSVTFTVTEVAKENTTIDLDVLVYEDTALIMVDLDKAATGLVKLYMVLKETGEDYIMYMDVVDGHVETFTNSIVPGNYSVVATYMGDSVFNTNTTSKDVEIVGHMLKDTPITANVVVNGNRVTLTVNVDENATGFVELKFGDNVFNIALTDGVGTLTTSLPYGNYSLDITYLGDENFNKNSTKCEFAVVAPTKENTTISLDVDVVSNENIAIFTVEVDSKATGIVKFEVTGAEEYSLYVDVIEGKAVFEDVLKDGNYTVIATYMGDSRFNTNVTSSDFTISTPAKPDINITLPDIVPGESSVVDVALPGDAAGTVFVLVGGKEVSSAPVTNGSAKVTIPELTAGNHTVEVKYSGDAKYASITKTSIVSVSKVDVPANSTSIKVTLAVGSKSPKFNITLPNDAKGYVVISINGIDYFASVENGTAIVNVPSLAYGNYSVNVTYSGDDKYNYLMNNTTAKIPKPKLTAKNIKIAYTNAYKYKVRVTIDGKAVVKQYVTFKFNKKTYKRLTNSKGYATLKLPKVKPKKTKYTITMSYKDIKLSKKIKVNSIIVAKNLKVKKSAKYLKIKVKLKTVAKKVQKGKKITLKFNGKKYKAKTNKKAIATFKIKNNVLKKLKVGKKYIYKVAYSKDVVNKKITVKK